MQNLKESTDDLYPLLRQLEPHLDAGQRTSQHELVEIAEMANTKNFARNLSEARSERHVEPVEQQRPECGFAEAVRQQDRRARTAVFGGIAGPDLQTPSTYRVARCLGQAIVPAKDVGQLFFHEHF